MNKAIMGIVGLAAVLVIIIVWVRLHGPEPPKELPPPGPIEEFGENLLETASNLRCGLSSIGKSFSDESIDTLVSIGNFADLAILEFFGGTLYTLDLIRGIISLLPLGIVSFVDNIAGIVAQMSVQVGAFDLEKVTAWIKVFLADLNKVIVASSQFLFIGFDTVLRVLVMLVREGISLFTMVIAGSKEAISGLMETAPGVAGLSLEALGELIKSMNELWKAFPALKTTAKFGALAPIYQRLGLFSK